MPPRLRRFLGSTVGLLPVRVRCGAARGARWTLFPWTSYWRGTHEPLLQAAISGLNGGDVTGWSCWDLGAHFGLYSVALARAVGPTGQVAAFEPNPESFRRLERHRRMNGLGWLKPFPAAVSDAAGTSELLTYGDLDSTSTHLAYEGEARGAAAAPIAIRLVQLDELVRRGEVRAPHFVKVDVEGHGHKAVAGMRETLAASRPRLIVAFHSPEEVAGVLAVLRPLGYRWEAIGPAAAGPEPAVGADYLFTP
jgi:FkbM family methyltransferase